MSSATQTVAAVSFLNARPLIDGLEREPSIELLTDVPSRLLESLLGSRASVALCPVIDYQLAPAELSIVPVGAIGSDGATHTVRVFSRRPIADIEQVHTDSDSHTSVALLEVVLEELHGRRPEMVILKSEISGLATPPEAVLLIGDKVVRDEPDSTIYPYQLDLGEAWKRTSGLPFVFATWLARRGDDLGSLPSMLRSRRDLNLSRIPEIVSAHADGWPVDLATRYLGQILQYRIGDREFESIELFFCRCKTLGLIDHIRPLNLYESSR